MTVIPFSPINVSHLSPRVRELEIALANSLGLLSTLVERVEAKLGPGALGDELHQFANSGPAIREFIASIDQLIDDGKKSTAIREYREFAHVTWDQANAAVGNWNYYPAEEKVRTLQLAQWVKSHSGRIEDEATPHESD